VDDIIDVWVLLEDLVKGSLICNIAFVESRPLAADELDAVDDFLGRVVEVVDDDDLVICFKKGEGREGANVAGTTRRLLVPMACDALLMMSGSL
jgi:hypothetical protein